MSPSIRIPHASVRVATQMGTHSCGWPLGMYVSCMQMRGSTHIPYCSEIFLTQFVSSEPTLLIVAGRRCWQGSPGWRSAAAPIFATLAWGARQRVCTQGWDPGKEDRQPARPETPGCYHPGHAGASRQWCCRPDLRRWRGGRNLLGAARCTSAREVMGLIGGALSAALVVAGVQVPRAESQAWWGADLGGWASGLSPLIGCSARSV